MVMIIVVWLDQKEKIGAGYTFQFIWQYLVIILGVLLVAYYSH